MTNNINIRISDIAKMAEVSTGTVDRVLHNRGHVSEEKRARIEKVLEEINYQPNMIARFLASKRSYTFVAVIPSYVKGEYWNLVCEGIRQATNELRNFNVTVKYIYFDQHDKESFLKVTADLSKSEYDGVLVATLFGDDVVELSKTLDEKNIPYIYIDSDIPDQGNLAYFGADSLMSGAIAAKLMLKEIGNQGEIIIANIKHKKKGISTQKLNREKGFVSYLKNNDFKGTIHHLEFETEDYANNASVLKNVLAKASAPVGGIVFNSRIYEFAFLINKVGDTGKNIKLIGYDLIPKNAEAIKNDQLLYLISQRPDLQGYNGIKSLSNYLIFKETPPKINYMPIDILIKENVDYYDNYKL